MIRKKWLLNYNIQHSPWNSTLRLEIACVRDFYVLRSHMDSTRFRLFHVLCCKSPFISAEDLKLWHFKTIAFNGFESCLSPFDATCTCCCVLQFGKLSNTRRAFCFSPVEHADLGWGFTLSIENSRNST